MKNQVLLHKIYIWTLRILQKGSDPFGSGSTTLVFTSNYFVKYLIAMLIYDENGMIRQQVIILLKSR